MTNNLKYQSYIIEFENCPPHECRGIESSIFRFIFRDRNHKNNFKPVLLINPVRINNSQFDLAEMKCRGYALSVYDTLTNSKNAYENITKRNKNFGQVIGEHVAEIAISHDEGLATSLSKSEKNRGHFDFFEFAETNLQEKIINVEKIIP